VDALIAQLGSIARKQRTRSIAKPMDDFAAATRRVYATRDQVESQNQPKSPLSML
jgi:hypothetical protein